MEGKEEIEREYLSTSPFHFIQGGGGGGGVSVA